jgi:hypothetical protein
MSASREFPALFRFSKLLTREFATGLIGGRGKGVCFGVLGDLGVLGAQLLISSTLLLLVVRVRRLPPLSLGTQLFILSWLLLRFRLRLVAFRRPLRTTDDKVKCSLGLIFG